ncbi:Histone-lysine N-methyltransferase [Drechslerella dactyloides]|uniref:Histone-lysine N-methyltransferase n=1 Tax=Drechslerella dactyloides TaxID=74499 RepID=A0AAD6NJX2_DREDA|nr:Histone-lysine N-methyltransferase [Drechslerella dactyloides]
MTETTVLQAVAGQLRVEEVQDLEPPSSSTEFEVRKILGEKPDSVTGETLYLVRWKNFNKDDDTWEPVTNLECCQDVLKKWEEKKKAKLGPKNGKAKVPKTTKTLTVNGKGRGRKRSRSQSDSGPDSSNKRATNATTRSLQKLQIDSKEDHQPAPVDQSAAHPDRLAFIEKLKKLAGPEITIVNHVDADPSPPLDFTFVKDYVYRDGVPVPEEEFNWGCKTCKGPFGCATTQIEDCECAKMNHEDLHRLAYKHNGLLKFPQESAYAIHECNAHCDCYARCPNKVVLKGRQIPLEIFKTGNKGWGLRCPIDLPAGKFIDRYIGEVITPKEADSRTQIQELRGLTYLFDLDKFAEEDEDQEIYCVDGGDFGGVTRFINHSCEPNLMIHAVTHNRSRLDIYDLALFTCRKIKAGEELTFEYTRSEGVESDEEVPTEKQKFPCYCGAKKCRGWLW